MAKFRSQLNRTTASKKMLEKPLFLVTGFEFVLDDPDTENDPQEILEPLKGMPTCNEFLYEFEEKFYGNQ